MAKDTIIYGHRCRWFSPYYMWVSDDGKHAFASDKNNRYNPTGKKTLKISLDPGGRKYAAHTYGYTVYIDNAVIICFCPPAPKDGKTYEIHHKDGNLANCHYMNLEWVPYHYHHATTDKVKLKHNGKTIEVHKDGTIKMSGQKLIVEDSFYDPDLDLEVSSWAPYVGIPRKHSIHLERVFIDDLMEEAGFINGDDADMQHPKVLHKDNNYMNCSSDNLEWVEESDVRYKAFVDQRKKDYKDKEVKNNPGKSVDY